MKGVLLFAFNNGFVDYYRMAEQTAKRVERFLKLPVTIVTDSESIPNTLDYQFDNTILADKQTGNMKGNTQWNNKGRYRAYELTPYTETLILDTDYLVNSDMLLKPFELYDDFMCHRDTSFLMIKDPMQEMVSPSSFQSVWATVVYFKKTDRTKQIFECLQMVQDNYSHYVNLYNIPSIMFRNDYALTIALRIVNGHRENMNDYIPWPLLHLSNEVHAYRDNDTQYTLIKDKKYLVISDTDFHLLNKNNFMELVNE